MQLGDKGILEINGPSIANEMRAIADKIEARYVVVAINYDRNKCRSFGHKSLAMAARRCGSINRGKLRAHGDFALAVVTKDNRVYNHAECERILQDNK